MTLIYECNLDNLKMYHHTKNAASRSQLTKVRAQTGQTHTQIDRCDRMPHSQVVINQSDCTYSDHRQGKLASNMMIGIVVIGELLGSTQQIGD